MLSHLKIGAMLWKMKVNDRAEKRLATLTLLTFKENLVSPLSTATQMRCLRNLGKRDSKEHESEMQYFGKMMGGKFCTCSKACRVNIPRCCICVKPLNIPIENARYYIKLERVLIKLWLKAQNQVNDIVPKEVKEGRSKKMPWLSIIKICIRILLLNPREDKN